MTYTTDWKAPSCTCPAFRRTGEICKHIRAAQDAEARRGQSATRAKFAGTDEEYRTAIQTEIDSLFGPAEKREEPPTRAALEELDAFGDPVQPEHCHLCGGRVVRERFTIIRNGDCWTFLARKCKSVCRLHGTCTASAVRTVDR